MRLISKNEVDDVQFAMLRARFNRVAWVRPIILSILVAVLILTQIGDHAVWRRWILGVIGAAVVFQSIRALLNPERFHPARQIAGRHVWIFAALTSGALFSATGGFQPAILPWAKMGALLLALAWAAVVSNSVREVFRQIISDAFDARDEVLKSHDAHAREAD